MTDLYKKNSSFVLDMEISWNVIIILNECRIGLFYTAAVVGKICCQVKPEFLLSPMNNYFQETKEILNQMRVNDDLT